MKRVTTAEDEEQKQEVELEPETVTVLEKEKSFTQIPDAVMLKIWNFVDFDGLTTLGGLFLQFSEKKNSKKKKIFFFVI